MKLPLLGTQRHVTRENESGTGSPMSKEVPASGKTCQAIYLPSLIHRQATAMLL